MVEHLAGENVLVGCHVLGALALGPILRRRLDPPRQGGDDRGCDLVLDREDVVQLAVVAIGPDVRVGFGIDQLDRDPHRFKALRTLPSTT